MNDEINEILDYFRKYMSIDDCIRLSKIEDCITNLQEGNHNLLQEIEYMQNINNKLIERNEKAIEYIKQYREVYYPDEPLSEPVIQYSLGIYEEDFDEEKLLNILQGEDKDVKDKR